MTLPRFLCLFLIIIIVACKSAETPKLEEAKARNIHKELLNLIEKDSTAAFKSLFNKSNFEPNHVNRGTTLLFKAVAKNNHEISQFLLKNGADSNYLSRYGTVMHWALKSGYTEIAELLLEKGFDPSIEEKLPKNPNPLNVRAAFLIEEGEKNIALFEALLAHGMNPDLRDKNGASSLILCCYFSKAEVISLLHHRRANMNIRAISWKDNPNFQPTEFTINHYTPLMIATLFEKIEVVKQLLSYPEVDRTIEGLRNHKTAYDIAVDTQNEELIALFE